MTDHRPPVDGLQLRLRDARDSADLLELFNQERFLRYASARGPFAATSDLETWLANIACANRVEVVGVVDSKAIGFGGLYVMGDGLGHSGWVLLGVNEARQGRGVGARVLQLLLAAASVMIGLRRVQLTVFADNDAAIRLYQRFGFEIEGRHRDFVRRGEHFIDAFTMAKVYGGRPAIAPDIEAAAPGPRPRPILADAARPH
jgi:L-phenylalanine/L-methionine N-acetyltransferase